MKVLGIHVGHDSSAALVVDGRVAAAVDEERFTRKKHGGDFPFASIRYCLEVAGGSVDRVAVSDDLLNSEVHACLELRPEQISQATYIGRQRGSLYNLLRGAKRKAQPAQRPPEYLRVADRLAGAVYYSVGHHYSHAAATYYTSGLRDDVLILTMDGIGDHDSVCIWQPKAGGLERRYAAGRTGSLGWFYSLVTEGLGWRAGDGEGKTMGLAPYGDPAGLPREALEQFLPRYRNGELATPHDFGKIGTTRYSGSYHWHLPESDRVANLAQRYGREAVAALAQRLLEEECLELVEAWKSRTGARYLVAGGGIFLNVKLSQKIVESGWFEDYFVFPSAGDSGLSVGAALAATYHDREFDGGERMRDVYWGPEFDDETVRRILQDRNLSFEELDDPCESAAQLLHEGKILGWFQGRMEFGPRALGARSILVDPTSADNKEILNARVKFREPFRPFCPSMKAEAAPGLLHGGERPERYMSSAYSVREDRRSSIPAVVHVDGTARPQIVERDVFPRFWSLLDAFERRSGTPVLLNTSFNVQGEPIVCSPRDAIRCFFDSGLDALLIGSFLVRK